MKKIYLLLLLCCISLSVFAQTYQPSGTSTFTGAATYCAPATATPLVYTYTTCTGGTGTPTGVQASITWYYNTTNTTVIDGSTYTAASPTLFFTATAATGTRTFTPPTSIAGVFYYFCVITWIGGDAGCPGGVSGSITSGTQLVTVNTTPISGPSSVCLGSSITLIDATAGGVWSSQNSGVASVNTTGVVTGVSAGNVNIFYAIGACQVAKFITVNDTPAAVSPVNARVCIGATTNLTDGTGGGTWSTAGTAFSVDAATGAVTGVNAGTARVTYQLTSTGCYTTRIVSVNPNPLPVGGTLGVCRTNTTPLSDASIGGTWSSSTPAIGSVNTTTGLVRGNEQGIATISYTLPTGCYATAIVSVGIPPAAITGTAFTVCSGGSTINLADATSGGTWTSTTTNASVGSTGVVTGVNPGTTTISYTTPGCTGVGHDVTVNPLPGVITGILNACRGLTTNLSNATAGGTWTSSNPGVGTIDSSTGIFTGIALGTTTISYALGTSSCRATAVVTVHPFAPIVGSDTICVGSSTLLTDIVGGGTWASSNPANASVDPASGIVTGLVDGITFIVYTTPAACSTSFFLRVLPPLPTIAGMQKICSGSVSALSDVSTGGTWSSDNASIAGVDTAGMLSAHFPGTTTINYAIFGCVTHAVVTVNALPAATVTYNWGAHTLSTQNYFTSYQWYDSSSLGIIPIAGATNNSYVVTAPIHDIYRVIVTDTNGCSSATAWRDFTAVANIDMASVNVYPNPASNKVFIDAPVALKAVITGLEGRIMLTQEKATEINISQLPAGVYLLSLSDETGQVLTVRKLLKE